MRFDMLSHLIAIPCVSHRREQTLPQLGYFQELDDVKNLVHIAACMQEAQRLIRMFN
jgi:hypothetical protein